VRRFPAKPPRLVHSACARINAVDGPAKRVFYAEQFQTLFFSLKSYRTAIIAARYRLWQIKFAAKSLGNPAVAAHCKVAHRAYVAVVAALHLPSIYQRTVIKIHVKVIVRATQDFHLKNRLSGKFEQLPFQHLKAGRCTLIRRLPALVQAAAPYGLRRKAVAVQSVFFGLVKQKIHPQGPVLKQLPQTAYQKRFVSRYVFYIGHRFLRIFPV
jgi:hypothetical protein